MMQRNNVGFPAPTMMKPLDELDISLSHLARNLRLNYKAVNIPVQLIRNMVISPDSIVELQLRAYHIPIEDPPAVSISSMTEPEFPLPLDISGERSITGCEWL